MTVSFFCGLFAPGGTPRAIIDRINQATQKILRDEQFQDRLVGIGYQPMYDYGPSQARAFIRSEQERWTPIIKQSGTVTE